MIHKNIAEELDKIAFVKRAAEWFSKNPEGRTFSDGDILPECLFALRWGLDEDCVLVFRIGDQPPELYTQCIKPI